MTPGSGSLRSTRLRAGALTFVRRMSPKMAQGCRHHHPPDRTLSRDKLAVDEVPAIA
jgi:hypothetical protein